MKWYAVIVGIILGIIYTIVPKAALAQEELPPAPDVPSPPVSSSLFDGLLVMSNEAMIMLVFSAVLPLVTSVLVKQGWSDDIKAGIYFLVSLAFGLVYTLSLDEWDVADMGRRVILVFVAGTLFYLTLKGPMQSLTTRTDSMMGRSA